MSTPSQVESIFFAALSKNTAEERADYLNDACGGDAELRRRLERLLGAHPQAINFMARPAFEHPGSDALEHEPPLPDRHRPFRPTPPFTSRKSTNAQSSPRLCQRNGRPIISRRPST